MDVIAAIAFVIMALIMTGIAVMLSEIRRGLKIVEAELDEQREQVARLRDEIILLQREAALLNPAGSTAIAEGPP